MVAKYFFEWQKGSINIIGRAIQLFSIGLLFQIFGQNAFSFYISILKVSVPYPSIADVGFFGSIVFYICGLLLLGSVSDIGLTLKSFKNKIEIIILPIALFVISYFFFLHGYHFDWNNPFTILLDFAYLLGETLYVSLALIILFRAQNLGGEPMKWPLIFFAMFAQYAADFNFLYQANRGIWINDGYGDLLYMTAYFLIGLSVLSFGIIFKNVIMEKLITTGKI